MLKILVGCEESQAVTIAFRNRGFEAYSCDTQPCSGGHPEWHIQGDVTKILWYKWDLIIAFPPCTYISNAGAVRLYPQKGVLNQERYAKGLQGKEFFMQLYNADCPFICVENPIPSTVFEMPRYSQIIQPYEYGHAFSKKTCLWLKGLPKLKPTNLITDGIDPWVGAQKGKGGHRSPLMRSKTFPNIADAMAEQWGQYLFLKHFS